MLTVISLLPCTIANSLFCMHLTTILVVFFLAIRFSTQGQLTADKGNKLQTNYESLTKT